MSKTAKIPEAIMGIEEWVRGERARVLTSSDGYRLHILPFVTVPEDGLSQEFCVVIDYGV
ncbi:hypothetical protein EON65_00280 [archaeon]|nr:MAG: hypothetical protein EON65_00280 [archaeon]